VKGMGKGREVGWKRGGTGVGKREGRGEGEGGTGRGGT